MKKSRKAPVARRAIKKYWAEQYHAALARKSYCEGWMEFNKVDRNEYGYDHWDEQRRRAVVEAEEAYRRYVVA